MKTSRKLLLALAASATVLWAQPAPAPAPAPAPTDKASAADKAFANIQVIANAPIMIASTRAHAESPMSREQSQALMAASTELVVPLAEKFIADYPTDPRRWRAVSTLLFRTPAFNGPDAAAQKAAWEKRRADWREQLIAAPDAEEATVASLLEHEIYAAAGTRGFSEQAPDLAKAGALVDLMAQRVPHSDRRRFAERHYLEELAKKDPAATEARLRRLAAEKEINPALAEQSVGMLLAIDGQRAPLELKFTALDGSAIDLADYRGKVVLVDFWATWCVPCMEEMPNVKKVYQAYHDKGLEIIGVSLDRAPRNPAKPTPFEKTADQLKEFIVKEDMPWPEHYDGKWWDNEFSRRFALGSIPASFLIGKDGRVISTENHGENLETNVRQALGL